MTTTNDKGAKSKREQERVNKITILQKLNKRKSILWPKQNSAITSTDRQAAWESVRTELVDDGLLEYANRDWKYLRDVTWKNWQSRFMSKIDSIRQNRNNEIRTEEEELMLSIIDEETPTPSNQSTTNELQPQQSPSTSISHLPLTSTVQLPAPLERRPKKRSQRMCVWEERIAEQKHQKLLLENRLLELQIQEKEAQIARLNFNFNNNNLLNDTDSNVDECKNQPLN